MPLRGKIGVLAIVLLAAAGALLLGYLGPDVAETWAGALVRVGLVLAAAWLALPQLRGVPPWMIALALALLVILARWPRYFFVALIAAAVLAIFRPKTR